MLWMLVCRSASSASCRLVFLVSMSLAWGFSEPLCGDDFPQVYNSDPEKDAEPIPAKEAARSMQVPPGFRVNVFAKEPQVQNPIAMAWDARGRIWIAENYTYAERSQRFDLSLRDRVVILEDSDGDGSADKRTVFTDQVQMLTSVEVGRGGVWLMCPPQLLFIPDRNHDDQPDGPPEVVLDGFEVAKENYHNFANGLRWGPDGWLYGRCGGSCPGRVGKPGTPADQRVALEGGIWRFSPRTRQFEVLTHGTTNPWGHDWNEFGEGFFINTVNGHLWHLIPGAHFVRPFTLDPNPHVYELIDMHADHWHFNTGESWTKSRDGAANAYGGGHAHVGMMIYQGNNWPDAYRGRLFTWNLHGRRANQELLERRGSGYVAKHGEDMFLVADPFFRGMDLSYGPDGAVYAIDWSDTGECHEHTGVHRTSGRVYRIAHQGRRSKPEKAFAAGAAPRSDDTTLLAWTAHPNAWFARQARLKLAELADDEEPLSRSQALSDNLREQVTSQDPVLAYRALVALFSMQAADEAFLRQQLSHRNEHIRAWAIRLLADNWPIDDVFGPILVDSKRRERILGEAERLRGEFAKLADEDPSGLVRLTLASTLQRLPLKERCQLASRLMRRQEDAVDDNLPLLVWYGLAPVAETHPDQLAEAGIRSLWPKTQALIVRRLAEEIDEHPQAVDLLIAAAAAAKDVAVRRNIVAGLADGLRGWTKAATPVRWNALAATVAAEDDPKLQSMVRELSVVFGDGRALEEVRRIVLDNSAEISLRRSALSTLVAAERGDVREICLQLLDDPRLNVVAARGLAKSADPEVASALVKNYRRFRAPHRPKTIAVLVSRPEFAEVLLDAIESKKIPATDLTAFDVRQIRSLGDAGLQQRTEELWGAVRESSEEKQERIATLQKLVAREPTASRNASRGRLLFNRSCVKCHKLFGVGESIGPDLTGGNRSNLDYLLQNIVDPSAIVSKDYRMTIVQTRDGQTLNGLVVNKNDKTMTLQTQTDRLTLPIKSIRATRLTSLSPMPDGLLDNLNESEIQDLLFYLMQPAQAPLPVESE